MKNFFFIIIVIFAKFSNTIYFVFALFWRSRFDKFWVGICGYETVFIIFYVYLGFMTRHYHPFLRTESCTEYFDTKYGFTMQRQLFFFIFFFFRDCDLTQLDRRIYLKLLFPKPVFLKTFSVIPREPIAQKFQKNSQMCSREIIRAWL